MLQRLHKAGLIWPTVAAFAGLVVLIGLGTWQMERKRWKEDLIAKIADRARADPITLFSKKHEGPWQSFTKGDLEYLHVAETGRFHHDKERYLYAPTPAGVGWHVYTPLELLSGHVMWVNRGWVPDARKVPETRADGQLPGEVEVRGLVRLQTRPGWFTPQNDPARNLWYWPDIAAMTASAFPEGSQKAPGGPQRPVSLPLVLEADAQPEPPGGLPRGGVTRLELPNRHLEYALTWYGLAATLIGVYLTFSFSRLRGVG
jgi:surfeit locus 1 family protein